LVERVAAEAFELDSARVSVPPHDGLDLPQLRAAMLAVNHELTAEELAATAGVAARPLYRVLRALAGLGVFAHEADGRFRLNPLAEPLREGGPDSLRAFAVLLGEEQYSSWDDLLETVRTGEPTFERCYGSPLFAYLSEHPEQPRIFDAAMTGVGGRAMQAMLGAYDLSDVRTLADVGGPRREPDPHPRLLPGVMPRQFRMPARIVQNAASPAKKCQTDPLTMSHEQRGAARSRR
jgi:hypothetical protein